MSLKINQKLFDDIRLQRRILGLGEVSDRSQFKLSLPGSPSHNTSDSEVDDYPRKAKSGNQPKNANDSKRHSRKKSQDVGRERRRGLNVVEGSSPINAIHYDNVSLHSEEVSSSSRRHHHLGNETPNRTVAATRRSLDMGEVSRRRLLEGEEHTLAYHQANAADSYVQLREISRDAQRLSEILHGWKKKNKKTRQGEKRAMDFDESLKLLARLQKATNKLNADTPRQSVDLTSFPHELYGDTNPRASFEGKVSARSSNADLRDAIRASLHRQKMLHISEDHSNNKQPKKSSSGEQKKRIPNVVARLMGLDDLPSETKKSEDKKKVGKETNGRQQRASQSEMVLKNAIKERAEGSSENLKKRVNVSADHETSRTLKEILEAIHRKVMPPSSFNHPKDHEALKKPLQKGDQDHSRTYREGVNKSEDFSRTPNVKVGKSLPVDKEVVPPRNKAIELHHKNTTASRNKQGKDNAKVVAKKKAVADETFRKKVTSAPIPEQTKVYSEKTVKDFHQDSSPRAPPTPPPPPPPPRDGSFLQDLKRRTLKPHNPFKNGGKTSYDPFPKKMYKPQVETLEISEKESTQEKINEKEYTEEKANVNRDTESNKETINVTKDKLDSKFAHRISRAFERALQKPQPYEESKHSHSSLSSRSNKENTQCSTNDKDEASSRVYTRSQSSEISKIESSSRVYTRSQSSEISKISKIETSSSVEETCNIEPTTPRQEEVKEVRNHECFETIIIQEECEPTTIIQEECEPSPSPSQECTEQAMETFKEEEEEVVPSKGINFRDFISDILRSTNNKNRSTDSAELYPQMYLKVEEEEAMMMKKNQIYTEEEIIERRVLLDCIKELLRRKMRMRIERKQAWSLKSALMPNITIDRYMKAEDVVKELCEDVEMLMAAHIDDENVSGNVESDIVYGVLQKDLVEMKRAGLNSVWSWSWESGLYGHDDAHEVCKELERLVFDDILNEFLGDLGCVV